MPTQIKRLSTRTKNDMGLTRRKPQATKPASHYAELTGLSTKTIKRKLREAGLKEVRYSTAPTAEVFFFQQEADRVIASIQSR